MPQTLSFTEVGQGPPLVLIHGLGGERQQWLDLLPSDFPFRILLPDLPGHGQTNWLPSSGCSFDSFADAAYQWLLTQPGAEKIIVGGISMGAGIALRVALLAPERVSKLVLIRPAWLDKPLPDNLSILHRLGKQWQQQTAEQTQQWLLQDEQYRTLAEESPACAKSVMGQLKRPNAALAAQTLVDMTASTPITTQTGLNQLMMPTLVIGSPRDPLHPLEMAHTWTNWLPNAVFHEVASRYEQPEEHRQQLINQLAHFL